MEFNIVDKMMGFTLLGAEWVLWLLIVLSILSIAVIIERALFFMKNNINYPQFQEQISSLLDQDKYPEAIDLCKNLNSSESEIALIGLENRNKGEKRMEGSMESYTGTLKLKMDRGLVFSWNSRK